MGWRALDIWCVHNEEDLAGMLRETGFVNILRFVALSGSQPAFCDLEVGKARLHAIEAPQGMEPRL